MEALDFWWPAAVRLGAKAFRSFLMLEKDH